MLDGRSHSLPLGELPYTVVQELKRRFVGEASLVGATGGALAARTLAANQ